MSTENYRDWLCERIERYQRLKPQRTLRALARAASMSPGSLSEILSGKRPLTMPAALKIADGLKLPAHERQALLHAMAGTIDAVPPTPRGQIEKKAPHAKIESARFRVIADWYHYAILGLAEVEGSRFSMKWLSKRLALPTLQIEQAVTRLKSVGLIAIAGGRYRQTTPPITTTRDIRDDAIRRHHEQMLRKAEESLHQDDISERYLSSITMAIDPDKLAEAKDAITAFRRELSERLGSGKKTRVYTLAVQLFPLDRGAP